MDIEYGSFVWDSDKEKINVLKHAVSFRAAIEVFRDSNKKIIEDIDHSENEERHYCIGLVDGRVMTVRYVLRNGSIRIFGAGYWKKGRMIYEQT